MIPCCVTVGGSVSLKINWHVPEALKTHVWRYRLMDQEADSITQWLRKTWAHLKDVA